MADLEELGFVTSPHTSAGRIPTDKGYRFFVDTLLKLKPLEDDRRSCRAAAAPRGAPATNPRRWSPPPRRLLSSVTQLAGVVTLPRQTHAALTQIEFVGLSDNRVLAILVVNGREVQNRILQLERHYSPEELRRASNYLNEEFRGTDAAARCATTSLAQLQETREHMNQLMLDAIQLAQQVVESGEPAAWNT